MKVLRGRIPYLVILILAVLGPIVLRSAYWREVLVMTCIFAILALSLDVFLGYAGQLSFGHAAFFGLGVYGGALTAQSPLGLGMSPWLGMLVGIGLAMAAGFVIGYITLRKLRGMYLAIVTFGFGGVLYLIVLSWYDLTRGMTGIYNIPYPTIALPYLPKVVLESSFLYYYFALAVLVLVIYFINRWLHTRFGRAVIALRENEELACSMGVNVFKHYVLTFTLAAALAGLAGVLFVYHIGVASPVQLGTDYILIMFVMVVMGGSGTLGGPVLGAFIYTWLAELLRVTAELRFVVLGVIFILFIVIMPRGIYPALVSLGERFKSFIGQKTKIRLI